MSGREPSSAMAATTRTSRPLIHESNTTEWKPGDLVIHDDDAKRPDMLMVVLGRSKAGIYRTRYAFPDQQPKPWRRKVWRNTVESLHDPRRFGIALKANKDAPLTLESLRATAQSVTHSDPALISSAAAAKSTR
jgi:hypothetical protein